MNRVEASTIIRRSPQPIYDLLVDFSRYPRYSKYLADVSPRGDGDEGTEYDLTFKWWQLSYTVHSSVSTLDPPHRIAWQIDGPLQAHGEWEIVETEDPPAQVDAASRVHFRVRFDPDSVDPDSIDLPSVVSLDWVLSKATPKVRSEAERVLERIVTDLEGTRRPVELTIHHSP